MAARSGFFLSKWYLDAVGDDGSVFLGYSARLRWNLLRIHYTSILTSGPAGETSRRWLVPCPSPVAADGEIRWRSRRIGVNGVWRSRASAVCRELAATDRGHIRWNCLQPASEAELGLRGHADLRGRGYVERLEMTLPPGDLRIRELRWGRFSSGDESLVWIDWRGPAPLTVVVRNGRSGTEGRVADDGLALDDGQLRFSGSRVLREGRLGGTALSGVPGIRRTASASLLAAQETKWLSQATLTTTSQRLTGWAIHELIRFPQDGAPPEA